MERGKVKWFDQKRGYGFITRDSGGEVFVHISNIDGGQILQENNVVEYEVGPGKKGEQALTVKVVKK